MNNNDYYADDDYELPPFHSTFVQTQIQNENDLNGWIEYSKIRPQQVKKLQQDLWDWTYNLFFTSGKYEREYDYTNIYDPHCDTAVYLFMEDIVLDFSDMDEDEEYYPFGWWNFYDYCARIGVVLPSFKDGGKYGKSMQWE